MRKIPVKSLLILLGFITLFALVAKFSLKQITDLRGKVTIAQKDQKILAEKLSALDKFENEYSQSSQPISLVLPSKNPSMLALSQIKRLAVDNGLLLSNTQSSSDLKDKNQIRSIRIGFELEGERLAVLNFIKEIENMAPISSVEEVKLNEIASTAKAKVSLITFFSPLPEKIPALTEPVNDLTPEETEILNQVLNLRQPPFSEAMPSETQVRGDPFQF